MERQAPNVGRMRLLGAEVVPVTSGDRTLRAAIDEAMRDWVADPIDTYYLLGSAVGPHPYPYLVRELQAVIGREARAQMLDATGALPDARHRLRRRRLQLHRHVPRLHRRSRRSRSSASRPAAAAQALGDNAATLAHGRPGVLHGTYSMLLQNEDGQIQETHSVSAGLDYPGVGPEHALLHAIGRVRYETASDAEALAAVRSAERVRGHPAGASRARMRSPARSAGRARIRAARSWSCLSGRGDKDMPTLQQTAR